MKPRVVNSVKPHHLSVITSLQYLSSLHAGEGRRLRLIYGGFGENSFLEFCASHGEKAEFVVQCARAVAAAIHCRVDLHRRSLPNNGLQLIDGRIPWFQRHIIAQHMLRLPACCRGPFWDRVFQTVQRPEELLGARMQRWLQGWGQIMNRSLSIAGLERRNRRSKAVLTTKKQTWTHFAAVSVAKELEGQVNATVDRDREVAVQTPDEEDLPPSPPPPAAEERKPPRGKSPFEAFLAHQFQLGRERGEYMNKLGFSAAWRREMKEEFDALTDAEKEHYEWESRASKALAASGRLAC